MPVKTTKKPAKKRVRVKDGRRKGTRPATSFKPNVVKTGKKAKHHWIRVGRKYFEIASGEEKLSEWTVEELIRGARNGDSLPKAIPLAVFQELTFRMVNDARHDFIKELSVAVDKHMKIIHSIDPTDATPVDLKAIEMLYDRVLGKSTEHIALHDGGDLPSWQKAVAQGIVGSVEQLPAGDEIIDGEVVEE